MKLYAVTAIDFGDSVDGHASFLGVFSTRDKAVEYIKEDMKDTIRSSATETEVDEEQHEVWVKDCVMQNGCIWDIHEIDTDKVDENEVGNPK